MFVTRPVLGPIAVFFIFSSARFLQPFQVNAGYAGLRMARRHMTPPEENIPDRDHFAHRLMAVREDANRVLEPVDLAKAIERDDRFRVDELISAGFHRKCPCVVVETGEVLNPLQFAVLHGRRTWIQILLATGDFDVNCKTEKEGNSLLHMLIIQKDLDIMQILLDAGVDIDAVNNAGQSALALSTMSSDLTVFNFLVSHKATVNAQVAIAACSYETPEALVEILKFPGLDMNEIGPEGTSVLFLAIRRNLPNPIVELILKYPGINVNLAERETGWTALHLSCSGQKYELAQILLEYGANPLLTDLRGNRPLHLVDTNSFKLYKIMLEAENKQKTLNVATLIMTASGHPEGGYFQHMPLDIMRLIGTTIVALASTEDVVPEEVEDRIWLVEFRAERMAAIRRQLTSEPAVLVLDRLVIEQIITALDDLDLTLDTRTWNRSVSSVASSLLQLNIDGESELGTVIHIPIYLIQSIEALKDRPISRYLELEHFAELDEEDFDGPIPWDGF